MEQDIIPSLVLGASFLALFGLSEWLYYGRSFPVELTRKITHAGTGLLSLFFPLIFETFWSVLVLCAGFAVLLVISKKKGFLKSINSVGRKSYGSLLYPLSVFSCFLFCKLSKHGLVVFYLPILTLAISDPLAALVGRRFGVKDYRVLGHRKTYLGSFAFLASAFLLACMASTLMGFGFLKLLLFSLIFGFVVTAIEAFSSRGWDNLTIPFAAVVVIVLFAT